MPRPRSESRTANLSRERDEELLDWLRWRAEGYSVRTIAHHSGASPGAVALATNNVLADDTAHSPNEKIKRYYWQPKQKG